MTENVLAKRGAIAKGTEGLDDLGVQVVDAHIECRLLAGLADALLHKVGGLLVHLLNAGWVNAAVGDQVLKGDACGLATNRIEAGEDDGLRGVVNDEIDAGNLLERADVAAFASDDAALEVV